MTTLNEATQQFIDALPAPPEGYSLAVFPPSQLTADTRIGDLATTGGPTAVIVLTITDDSGAQQK